MITTETKTIYKLPLAKVTYPEKNLLYFRKMRKEERAEKRKKAKEKQQQLQEKEAAQDQNENVVKVVIETTTVEL